MKTFFDFKKVGEKLKRDWKRPYLLVGCPFRETADTAEDARQKLEKRYAGWVRACIGERRE